MNNKKEETEEKPKAVVEMEENSDVGKAKRKIKEKKEQNTKEANKKFIIKYIVFLVIIVLITTVAIYFSINKITEDIQENEIEIMDITKPTAKDSKYAIDSYAETYDENSLKIKYYAGNDQLVENTYGGEEYAQIEGMLDKDIQNSINTRLKETAKKLKEGNRRTFSQVTANFGNILSVNIYNEDLKRETINIDLNTGNDIYIEDVFVSSAALNSLIMEGVFKSLAWDKLFENYEKNDGSIDMNKVDTSQYEDIALKVVNNFKLKGKAVQFYITTEGVTIYGITDQNMFKSNNEDSGIGVDFIGHREDVAIYKRYLTNKSIYENDSIGAKDIIVFTNNIYDDKYIYNLIYGQEDNVFVEEALLYYEQEKSKDNNTFEIIKKYLINKANEDRQRIKSQTKSELGVFYQKEINIWKQENYYCSSVTEYQATCEFSYFKDEAFKDYAKMKNGPRADVGLNGFIEYDKDEYPNLQISKINTTELYFDLEANYIGTTEAEAKAKINQNEMESVTEEKNTETTDMNTNTNSSLNNSLNEESTNTIENSNIIENEINQENNTIEQ